MTTRIQHGMTAIVKRLELSLARDADSSKLARAQKLAQSVQTIHRPYRHIAIAALVAVAMKAEQTSQYNHSISFDTDFGPIGVDNRCTGCISHRIEDFDGPLRESHRSIKGFGGSRTTNIKIGTIAWQWDDANGKTHKFRIPNSFYVPGGNV